MVATHNVRGLQLPCTDGKKIRVGAEEELAPNRQQQVDSLSQSAEAPEILGLEDSQRHHIIMRGVAAVVCAQLQVSREFQGRSVLAALVQRSRLGETEAE
ncbi:MAG: hypothetical protein HZC42_00180 [Candidatus Eisenbacteria bacterium]|nr:hypothetical protein [Candidatus Eisenbacteria bacterium]